MSGNLVKKLRSQIGDDLQEVYSHEALFRHAADAIEQLTAERDLLREALSFYADFHEVPSDGPWGVESRDFGDIARAALKGETP